MSPYKGANPFGGHNSRFSHLFATDLVLSGLTAGSVLFAGAGGLISEDNSKLFWDNTGKVLTVDGRIGLTSDTLLSWGDQPTIPAITTFDLHLAREGPNILAQRNGLNAQTFRVYNMFVDPANIEGFEISHSLGNSRLLQRSAGTGIPRDLQVGTIGASNVQLMTNSILRWEVNPDGHLLSILDGAYDIGSVTKRARSIYWNTQALAPNGNANKPAYSFASDTDLGFYFVSAGQIRLAAADILAGQLEFGNTGIQEYYQSEVNPRISISRDQLGSGFAGIAFGIGTSAVDTIIGRDGSNHLAQRNGTNAQSFSLYNTFTDTANWEKLFFQCTGNQSRIYTQAAGTGIVRDLSIGTGNNSKWLFQGIDGHLVVSDDNALDIGALGANRPRTGYFGTSLNVGGGLGLGKFITDSGGYKEFYSDEANPRVHLSRDLLASGLSALGFGIGLSPVDVIIGREAANILAQRNGANPQVFRLYNTFTDVSNYERLSIRWLSNQLDIIGEQAGTGVARRLRLLGAQDIVFGAAGNEYWHITGTGHFLSAGGDNILDIGQTGSARPRTGFFGTSIVTPNILNASAILIRATIGDINLDAQGPGNLVFHTGAVQRWVIQPDGHLRAPAGAANTYDLGTSALTVRTGYFGTSVVSPIFVSNVATGTAPLTVASTTVVANLNADLLDGAHGSAYLARANHTGTQLLATISDVTISAANLNSLDDGLDSTLHFHASDRARGNHTGTQLLATISDITITAANLNILDDGVDTTLHFHAADRARANHTGTQIASTISDFASTVSGFLGSLIQKTANEQITSDSVLSNDAVLILALAANTKYKFKFTVFIKSDPQPNFKYRLTGPDSPTEIFFDDFIAGPTGNSHTVFQAYHSADRTVGYNVAGEKAVVVLSGIVHNGVTAGTLAFQWAQNTSHVDPTTVLAGSTLKYITF